MSDGDAREYLAALAGRSTAECDDTDPRPPAAYGGLIDAAVDATDSLDAATAFLADHDLADLERAVERAEGDLSARAEEGRVALETLRRLRDAAVDECQFQSGLRSPKGSEDVPDSR